MTKSEVQAILDDADVNNDGKLDYNEVTCLHMLITSHEPNEVELPHFCKDVPLDTSHVPLNVLDLKDVPLDTLNVLYVKDVPLSTIECLVLDCPQSQEK